MRGRVGATEPQVQGLSPNTLINDFAIRSFRDIADEDYIAARLSFRTELLYVANWQCQQAIEKYLKCILRLNRIPAKHVRHDLAAAMSLIEASDEVDLNLTPASKKLIDTSYSLANSGILKSLLSQHHREPR